MRKDTYENKLSDLLASNQFSESKGTSDWIVMKIEKDITKEMFGMQKYEKNENLTQGWGLLGSSPPGVMS